MCEQLLGQLLLVLEELQWWNPAGTRQLTALAGEHTAGESTQILVPLLKHPGLFHLLKWNNKFRGFSKECSSMEIWGVYSRALLILMVLGLTVFYVHE